MNGPRISRNQIGAFSLVELIAVVAIITLLLALGLGIFGGSRAQAVRTAGDQVSSMIERARTTAITRGKPVVLAFAVPGDAGFSDELCRLGLFELEQWEEDAAEVDARLIERWKKLPGGVVFFGSEVNGLANLFDQPAISMKWKDGAESAEFAALVFSERGGLLAPAGSESVALRMGAGLYQNGQPVEAGGGGNRTIRIGRVVARAWTFDS